MSRRFNPIAFHTPSTIPDCVRPEVIRGWNGLWRRLRKMSRTDRGLEFKTGTTLKVGAVQFIMRWVDRPEYVTEYGVFPERLPYGTRSCHRRSHVWILRLNGHEREVDGSCAFGDSKPYTHMDKFQEALDELIAINVMEA